MKSIRLTDSQNSLLIALLQHRSLELRTAAAYVAYSSAFNSSEKRVAEKKAQLEGAAEFAEILEKLE